MTANERWPPARLRLCPATHPRTNGTAPSRPHSTPSSRSTSRGFSNALSIATGPHAGRKALTLRTVGSNPPPDHPCIARLSGFSLHAGTVCEAHDRDSLERLCRYIARPALSNERLSVNDRGQVVYRLKHAFRDGTTHVVLDPVEFMRHIRVPHPFGAASGCANRQSCRFGIARLAAPEVPLAARARSVPRPRAYLTRYHGVLFAPNCKHRHRIIPNPAHQSAREPQASRPAPMRWMQRLGRVFHVDIEHCGVCGGTLRVIACIETPLKCRSLRELAHSSRRSSPISPRATPRASTAPAHRRSIHLSPNPRPPHLRPCPDCPHGCTTAPLRLASRVLRSPAPS